MQWSEDGSVESRDYGDVYFQRGQGLAESRYIYLDQNHLPECFTQIAKGRPFSIAELGFGTGLNFLVTADLFLKQAPDEAVLHYTSFEKHPLLSADLARIYDYWKDELPLTEDLLRLQPPLVEGFHTLSLANGRIRLTLIYGDVRDMLPQVTGKFDAWFLDGFAPKSNPDMWEESLLLDIGHRTKPGGTLATFTVAGKVWRGLEAAGFTVTKVKGFGIKWSMIAATMPGEKVLNEKMKTIAVIGAGIAGCSVAYALAQHGHAVTLIDRHSSPAREASGNPVGIIYPKMTADPSPSAQYYMTCFSHARAQLMALGLPSWQAYGVMHMDLSDEDSARHTAIPVRNEYPAEVSEYKPGQGLLQPLAGAVSPAEWCETLANHPLIEKTLDCEIAKLEKAESQWTLIDGKGENVITADIVIVACAYHSKIFDQTKWLPLQSLRGQLTFLTPTDASRKIENVVCHDGYIAPVRNGIHVAGASFQKEEPGPCDVRPEDHEETLGKLQKNLPQLSFTQSNITGGRTAYRATTPDKLPVIGHCPDFDHYVTNFAALRHGGTADDAKPVYHDGLYLMTGFGSHGLTTAPLAGEVIASMIDGSILPMPARLVPYMTADRLIIRDLKRRKI